MAPKETIINVEKCYLLWDKLCTEAGYLRMAINAIGLQIRNHILVW